MSTRPRRTPAPDLRVLALLVLGLLLGGGRLLADSPILSRSQAERSEAVYLWLSGDGLTEGLYRISAGAGNEAGIPMAFFQNEAFLDRGGGPALSFLPPRVLPLFFLPIPVNQADRDLLMTVPGIGPSLADSIIALRERKQKLHALPELLEATGIGKARLARLASHLYVETENTEGP